MSDRLSRRQFATMLATSGGALVVGFDSRSRSWITSARAQSAPFHDVPKLDGTLLLDEGSRRAIAVDTGNMFHRVPAAVLRPGSVQDVVKMVKYANEHGLKIAGRGHAHSKYGQTQVEGGLVIDMNGIRAVQPPATDHIDAQPGAEWGDVARAALDRGLTPPVLLTCMSLTVGGTLNAGGLGPTSQHHGAQIDTVTELDVVTGDGRLVTCAATKESELFNMVLGGQGQCGLIVRARIRLVRAPTHVVLQNLLHRSAETFLADQQRMVADGRFDHLDSIVNREADGAWSFTMQVGTFQIGPQEPTLAPLTEGLRFDHAAPQVRMTYAEYLYRNEERNTALLAGDRAFRPSPYLTMCIPASATPSFVALILGTPRHLSGMTRYVFWPVNTRRFIRPLLRVPDEPQAFAFWLFRAAPLGDERALSGILDSNRELLARMTAVGGTAYAPYTPVRTPAEWVEHFGPAVWKRFAAAKRKYDPKQVLSPYPAIFAAG